MTECGRMDGDRPERLLVLARCPRSTTTTQMTGMERMQRGIEGFSGINYLNRLNAGWKISSSSALGGRRTVNEIREIFLLFLAAAREQRSQTVGGETPRHLDTTCGDAERPSVT